MFWGSSCGGVGKENEMDGILSHRDPFEPEIIYQAANGENKLFSYGLDGE